MTRFFLIERGNIKHVLIFGAKGNTIVAKSLFIFGKDAGLEKSANIYLNVP